MNIFIDNVTLEEALHAIEGLVREKSRGVVITPNVDHIIRAERDPELKEIYENASLILADGKPLIWISKLYKAPIKQKLSGSDIFPHICAMAADRGFNVFLCGAAPGVAETAAENLKKKYDGLNIVGTYSPPYGFEKDIRQEKEAISIINAAGPDILVLGLGSPKQEKFYYRNRHSINAGVSCCFGASIDFEAGQVKRAPRWMSDHGLEWLYRLVKEPRRLFRRYLIEDIRILSLIFKYKKPTGNAG